MTRPAPEPRELSRRRMLRMTLGLTAGAIGGFGLSACAGGPLMPRIDIAGGENGGFYFEFATELSRALVADGIAGESRALRTEASVENLRLLGKGRAQLGLALADTADAERHSPTAKSELRALGRVYQNYFHCIVHADSHITKLHDLAGARLGVGAAGSGTWVTGQRILAASGLSQGSNPPRQQKLGYVDGLAALKAGDIDAHFLFGGIPVAAISELASSAHLRLLDLSDVLVTLRAQFPGLYDRVVVPKDTYPAIAEVETVGVANLLMCRTDLPDPVAAAVVRLLVDRAAELVPRHSAGIQFLTPETLIGTSTTPLHSAAAETYRDMHG